MSIKLRPYQEECLQSIHDHYLQGINRQIIHLPTAAGKTVIFANLIQQKNCRTLVLAHTLELLEQAKDKIEMICPELEVGLVNAYNKEFDKQVVVSTIQSARSPENLKQLQMQGFELLIYDEAHRSASDSARFVIESLDFVKGNKRLITGFSATPWRNGSKGLGEIFDKTVYSKSIKELIDLGFLSPPKGIKIKTDLDLSAVRTENGDFISESLASYMNTPELIDVVVNAYIENVNGRKAVCFSVTVDHAKNLADAFKARGITSEAIHGSMPQDVRATLLERFRNSEISILCNCIILTEGWDCPEVDCILLAKPTQSRGLYQQMIGRGLRLYPNKKDCLVLDFGSKSHSLCGVAELLEDIESEEEQKPKTESKMSEFAKCLPPSINKKLKAAIIEFDLLGDSFTWVQDGQSFSLKAYGDKVLKIFPTADGRFTVMFFNGNDAKTLCSDLTFEYAFSTAEVFASENRSQVRVSDLNAKWRSDPISINQMKCFRSHGYKNGIQDLTKGQASLIISSGVLNKKATQSRI